MWIDNSNFDDSAPDVLYHFGMGTGTHDFKKLFHDVKFVCIGGSTKRMEKLANILLQELNISTSPAVNICQSDRYVMFKAGPVLCVNHGMGMPSVSIMLHELFKILHHAGCTDVLFFRVGTSGGIGVPPGTVVITEQSYNSLLEPHFKLVAVGKTFHWPTTFNAELCNELYELANMLELPVIKGKTLGTDDFYEGQGRLDGALCAYTKDEKMEFLEKAKSLGIKNIEMEGPLFSALTNRAGVKAALVCVTLLDRTSGDQVISTVPVLKGFEDRPMKLVTEFIKRRLQIQVNGVNHVNGHI